jgi:hypothetical protein
MCTYIYINCISEAVSNGKRKTEAREISSNPFTVCSSCKQKFVVNPFVYKETNGSYPLQTDKTGLPIYAKREVAVTFES